MTTRQLSLNLFIHPTGHHEASWRHPSSRPDLIHTARYYQDLGRTAEAAKFDAVFFADIPALFDNVEYGAGGWLEPITTLTAIAAATERIGLIATASTTFYDPYNLARLFASLDHLSGGRAGWNIVTTASANAAGNFGLTRFPEPEERYARATEFVEAALRLWDSWEDDAILLDVAGGRYADPAKIHKAEFTGQYVNVQGALNAPRSPQGHPVLVQAGASNEGRGFAARYAEAIFTAHQRLEDGQAFYTDIKSRATSFGRNADHIKILPGISPFIGSTEAEAKILERELDQLTVPAYGLRQLSSLVGVTLGEELLDEPVPTELFAGAGDVTNNNRSRLQVVAGIVERERPTVRGLLHRLAGARGHRVVAGTPEQVADTIEEWFTNGAADGFNVMPPALPTGIDDFANHVVPILQARGLFRTEYSGTTLRDHFGLPRPVNRYTDGAADGYTVGGTGAHAVGGTDADGSAGASEPAADEAGATAELVRA